VGARANSSVRGRAARARKVEAQLDPGDRRVERADGAAQRREIARGKAVVGRGAGDVGMFDTATGLDMKREASWISLNR
jgi:hypothetical protein